LKFDLGLFDTPFTKSTSVTAQLSSVHLYAAKQAATKSCVLLKNKNQTLPLSKAKLSSLAVIGPLADDGYEQLGTWVFDGKAKHSITCLTAINDYVGDSVNVKFAIGMETSRSNNHDGFSKAIHIANSADVAIMILGEEAILSGEAHCRSNIDLPGCQEQLINAIYETGTPIVLVIMAGRPITLEKILPKVDAVLFAWHPGTMGGPAITELLFGEAFPSGKLPVTFPRNVGQIPLYYGQKNTGRPASDATFVDINDIEVRAPQTSLGMTSTHLDTHFSPLFPFGFGLSYSHIEYNDINASTYSVLMGESFYITATISNIGNYDAEEVVQLYIRDLVGSVTRPVKELKGFQRIFLPAGESETVIFKIHTDDLAFYNRQMKLTTEPGLFNAWIGGNSDAELKAEFEVVLRQE
jgi:beta-glucosidase